MRLKETLVNYGCRMYSSWQERNEIKRELHEEFEGKVTIESDNNGFIFYIHNYEAC